MNFFLNIKIENFYYCFKFYDGPDRTFNWAIPGIKYGLCFFVFYNEILFLFIIGVLREVEGGISKLLIVQDYTTNVCIHKRGADQFN